MLQQQQWQKQPQQHQPLHPHNVLNDKNGITKQMKQKNIVIEKNQAQQLQQLSPKCSSVDAEQRKKKATTKVVGDNIGVPTTSKVEQKTKKSKSNSCAPEASTATAATTTVTTKKKTSTAKVANSKQPDPQKLANSTNYNSKATIPKIIISSNPNGLKKQQPNILINNSTNATADAGVAGSKKKLIKKSATISNVEIEESTNAAIKKQHIQKELKQQLPPRSPMKESTVQKNNNNNHNLLVREDQSSCPKRTVGSKINQQQQKQILPPNDSISLNGSMPQLVEHSSRGFSENDLSFDNNNNSSFTGSPSPQTEGLGNKNRNNSYSENTCTLATTEQKHVQRHDKHEKNQDLHHEEDGDIGSPHYTTSGSKDDLPFHNLEIACEIDCIADDVNMNTDIHNNINDVDNQLDSYRNEEVGVLVSQSILQHDCDDDIADTSKDIFNASATSSKKKKKTKKKAQATELVSASIDTAADATAMNDTKGSKIKKTKKKCKKAQLTTNEPIPYYDPDDGNESYCFNPVISLSFNPLDMSTFDNEITYLTPLGLDISTTTDSFHQTDPTTTQQHIEQYEQTAEYDEDLDYEEEEMLDYGSSGITEMNESVTGSHYPQDSESTKSVVKDKSRNDFSKYQIQQPARLQKTTKAIVNIPVKVEASAIAMGVRYGDDDDYDNDDCSANAAITTAATRSRKHFDFGTVGTPTNTTGSSSDNDAFHSMNQSSHSARSSTSAWSKSSKQRNSRHRSTKVTPTSGITGGIGKLLSVATNVVNTTTTSISNTTASITTSASSIVSDNNNYYNHSNNTNNTNKNDTNDESSVTESVARSILGKITRRGKLSSTVTKNNTRGVLLIDNDDDDDDEY